MKNLLIINSNYICCIPIMEDIIGDIKFKNVKLYLDNTVVGQQTHSKMYRGLNHIYFETQSSINSNLFPIPIINNFLKVRCHVCNLWSEEQNFCSCIKSCNFLEFSEGVCNQILLCENYEKSIDFFIKNNDIKDNLKFVRRI